MAQAPPTRGENRPPVVESVQIDPKSPRPKDRLRAIAKGSDPDGDPVEFKYLWRIDGRPLAATTSEVDMGPVAKGSRIEVTVVGNDGHLESQPVTAVATVGNQPPDLTGVRLDAPAGISAGGSLVASPQATDADGDPITYHYTWWVNGHEVVGDQPSLDTSKLRRGDTVKVRVVASDGIDESDPIESDPLRVGNAPPKITSKPGGLDPDGVFRYTVQAVDPDGDQNLRYHLVKGPDGMTLDSMTGVMLWKPTTTQTGKQAVELSVDDLQGGIATQRFELSVGADQAQAATPAAATPAPPKPGPAPANAPPPPVGGVGTLTTGNPEATRTGGAPVPKAQRTQPPAASSEDTDEEAAAPAAPQPPHPYYRHHGPAPGAATPAPADGGDSAE
jgi:hypothetical protein